MNWVRRLWLWGPLSRLMTRVVMSAKRSLTVSHQSTNRSTRQSLVTLDVTPERKSSSEDGRKMPTGVTVAAGSCVVVGGLGGHPTLASAGKWAHLDRGFGIHREPQRACISIRLLVALLHLGKDGVGFREFFWGWLLATFFG